MSFSFQGPGEIPMIQNAQHMMNNGGGGNLGYFQGRRKKKEELGQAIFNVEDEDSFTLSSDSKAEEPENQKPKSLFKKLLDNFLGEEKEKN